MNDAPLPRRHGLHGHRPSSVHRPLRHAIGQRPQHLVSALPVPFHIDEDVNPVTGFPAQHEVQEILDCGQRFTLAADEEAGVLSIDLEGEWGRFGLRAFLVGTACRPLGEPDGGGDSHGAKQPFDGLFRQVHYVSQVRCVSQVHSVGAARPDEDPGILGAQAEDAASTLIDDDDLDVVALYPELLERLVDSLFDRPAGHL